MTRRQIKGVDQEDQEGDGVILPQIKQESNKKVPNLNDELSYFLKKIDVFIKGQNKDIEDVETSKELTKIGTMALKVFQDCSTSFHPQKELFKKKIIHSG